MGLNVDEWQATQERIKALEALVEIREAERDEARAEVGRAHRREAEEHLRVQQLEGALERMGRDFATAEGKDGANYADSYLASTPQPSDPRVGEFGKPRRGN